METAFNSQIYPMVFFWLYDISLKCPYEQYQNWTDCYRIFIFKYIPSCDSHFGISPKCPWVLARFEYCFETWVNSYTNYCRPKCTYYPLEACVLGLSTALTFLAPLLPPALDERPEWLDNRLSPLDGLSSSAHGESSIKSYTRRDTEGLSLKLSSASMEIFTYRAFHWHQAVLQQGRRIAQTIQGSHAHHAPCTQAIIMRLYHKWRSSWRNCYAK